MEWMDPQGHRRVPWPKNPKSYLWDGRITQDPDGCFIQKILSPTYGMNESTRTPTGALTKKS